MSPSADTDRLFDQLLALEKAGGVTAETRFLDGRTRAISMIGAAVCVSAPASAFRAVVQSALSAGATEQEVVEALLAVASIAGEARVVRAASRISLAMGYDTDLAFETE
jgi:alkylhydroperoxidase/carboxymuconolactone decarboxylase family protein YurZ